MPIKHPKNSFVYRSTDVGYSLPQSVVDAPSVQSFVGRLDKLWKNHPIKMILLHHLNYGLCHLYTHSHSLKTMIKTELAQEAGMPNSARKGPVRTCKYIRTAAAPRRSYPVETDTCGEHRPLTFTYFELLVRKLCTCMTNCLPTPRSVSFLIIKRLC